MKPLFVIFAILLLGIPTYAQGLLDDFNDDSSQESKDDIVYDVFGGLRLVSQQTTETLNKKTLSLQIQHRFGGLNGGFQQLFGLDAANVRLALSYGITDNIMVEVGRDKFNNVYDGIFKWRFLRQGSRVPLTVTYLTAVATTLRNNNVYEERFARRLSYVHQVLFSRKFGERVSVQLAPGLAHRSYVNFSNINNTIYNVGFGARFKVTPTIYFIADYVQMLNNTEDALKNPLGVGMEIITGGGHAFQLYFTNAEAMHENGFITATTSNFASSSLRFGFNITRLF